MRRFALYILVALITFGIGSFIAFKFYWKINDNSVNAKKVETFPQNSPATKPWEKPWKLSDKSIQDKEVSTKSSCSNEKILPVWKELIKDKTFQDWGKIPGESLDCADMLEVTEIDLNQDSIKEILLRGKNSNLCSAVGNCAFWIYERKGKKYRKLLYSTDHSDITEMPNQIKKSKTSDYFDVVLKGHFDASDTIYTYYNFNGRKYKENKCLVEACVICTGDNPKWEFIGYKEFYKRLELQR